MATQGRNLFQAIADGDAIIADSLDSGIETLPNDTYLCDGLSREIQQLKSVSLLSELPMNQLMLPA